MEKTIFTPESTRQMYRDSQVSKDSSAALRREAMEKAQAAKAETLEERIRQKLLVAWGEWVPDYEGWLKWSGGLYTPDSLIYAIGDNPQRFADYQAGMKHYRDACTMEMGPIMQIVVQHNVAALIYHMYLMPKDGSPMMDNVITEFNTFTEVDGQLKVSRLDLYSSANGRQ